MNKNTASALAWYEKSAGEGSAEAMYCLGKIHADGEGVPVDEGKAFEWFLRSAKAGHVAGMNNIGVCYETGSGVSKDEVEALAWFRRAADGGNPTGMYNLGLMYGKGQGTVKDLAESMRWCRKAADAGEPLATAFVEAVRLGPIISLWHQYAAALNEQDTYVLQGEECASAARLAGTVGDVAKFQDALNRRAQADQAALSAAKRAKNRLDRLGAYDPIDRTKAAREILNDPATPRTVREKLQEFAL